MHNRAATWPERPLGELLDIARQTVTPGAYPAEQFVHYSIPAWDERRGPALEIGASIGSAKICIKQPTILVSKLNPRIPRVVLVESPVGQRHCASTEFIPYVAQTDSVSLRFYKWFLQSPMFQRRLERIATGSTNSHTRAHPAETLKWNAPSPAPEEQRCIAVVLDTVDEAIAKTEAVITKLKQVRAGLLHDLLTRGLDEHGQLRDPITQPEQFQDSPFGRIPRDWRCEVLGNLVPPDRPIVYGILMPGRGFHGGVPVIKVKDIKDGQIDTSDLLLTDPRIDEVYRRSRVRTGDLLFTIRGTVGRMAFVPPELDAANITQDTARISLLDTNPLFIARWLEMPIPSRFIDVHTIGVAVKGINLGDVRRIPVVVPPKLEQDQIARVIASHEEMISTESNGLACLLKLKSGLMSDLLTGRVRVPDSISAVENQP
jgi:type I restriction enzyme S subunit